MNLMHARMMYIDLMNSIISISLFTFTKKKTELYNNIIFIPSTMQTKQKSLE